MKKTSGVLKKTTSRTSRPLTKTPGTIIFASYPKKKVDRKYIDAFWKRYFSGELKEATLKRKDGSVISSYNHLINILPLSPTVAVTVRKIDNGKKYLEIKKYFEKKFKENKPKYSEVVFADIIDYKIKDNNYYLMERIIPSVTAQDLLHYKENKKVSFKNRFSKSFYRTVEKMDPKNLEKMNNDLYRAIREIYDINRTMYKENRNMSLDSNVTNIIVIDYNPKIGKFKFGIIDVKRGVNSSF